jgi:hypothetical protein
MEPIKSAGKGSLLSGWSKAAFDQLSTASTSRSAAPTGRNYTKASRADGPRAAVLENFGGYQVSNFYHYNQQLAVDWTLAGYFASSALYISNVRRGSVAKSTGGVQFAISPTLRSTSSDHRMLISPA